MQQFLRIMNSCLSFCLVFGAVLIIVALWSGIAWLFSPLVLALSLLAAFFLHRKFPFELQASGVAWLVAALVLALVLYPVVLSGGVAASADAVSTIAVRVLGERIPVTYAPYSNVSFTYQLGFPLLVNTFSDVFFFVEDFRWAWIFGAVFAAVLVLMVFETAREWISPDAAIIAAVLVVASKLVFQNFYWGEFAWLAATVYMLATFLYWKKGHPFAVLSAAAVVALHPAIFFNLIVILAILFFYNPRAYNPLLLFPSVLIVAPALYFNYLPIALNLLVGKADGAGFELSRLVHVVPAVPLWIGGALTIIFVASLAAVLLEKKPLQRQLAVLWVAVTGIFLLLSSLDSVLAGREIELVLLATLLWASANWASTVVFSRHRHALLAGFLVVGLLFFYSSNSLAEARAGSKISPHEIEFAFKFRDIDNSAQKTIFLTPSGGKMAEIADKVPYDANSGFLISTARVLAVQNEGWEEFAERHRNQERIRRTSCVQCVLELPGVKYAVIDYNYAPMELPRRILAEAGNTRLYDLTQAP